MDNPVEKQMSEQATGCFQHGSLVYYDETGTKITPKQAEDLLKTNQQIEVPSAGAGSYKEIFTSLGFEEIEIIDSTSSAGDWTLGVKNCYGWFVAVQENRYPYHGFKYSISDLIVCFGTFEDLCKEVEEGLLIHTVYKNYFYLL